MDKASLLPPYPPDEDSSSIWDLRSYLRIALYMIGAWAIIRNVPIILILTFVLILHELGHYIAMRYYGYEDVGITILPIVGAYVKGYKQDVSQRESSIILLAGPTPGIIIGILCYFLSNSFHWSLGNVSLQQVAILFLLPNLLNLLPIYPLDGGQLLYRTLLNENERTFNIINALFIIFIILVAYSFNYLILYFVAAYIAMRMIKPPSILDKIEKRAIERNIDLNTSYEALTDQQYWDMRNLLIQYHPDFKHIAQAPPYQYATDEEKIAHTIKLLLNRYLILDMPWWGKGLIIIFLVGVFAFTTQIHVNWFFWISPFIT